MLSTIGCTCSLGWLISNDVAAHSIRKFCGMVVQTLLHDLLSFSSEFVFQSFWWLHTPSPGTTSPPRSLPALATPPPFSPGPCQGLLGPVSLAPPEVGNPPPPCGLITSVPWVLILMAKVAKLIAWQHPHSRSPSNRYEKEQKSVSCSSASLGLL